jgi:hypothetical protein
VGFAIPDHNETRPAKDKAAPLMARLIDALKVYSKPIRVKKIIELMNALDIGICDFGGHQHEAARRLASTAPVSESMAAVA